MISSPMTFTKLAKDKATLQHPFSPTPPYLSRNVGEIFWVNSDAGKDKEK
jgi:hypothetical protein